MKIGIYGGSFNPPHLGHLAAARAALSALELDRLLIVPAADPPHKVLTPDSAPPEDRLAMARILADLLLDPRVECWDAELARPGKSYTSDTLRAAHDRWPEAELWLLVGTDMFLSLQDWHEPEIVLSLAKVCAFGRGAGDGEALFAPQRERLARDFGAETVTLAIPDLVEVSSTEIRAALAAGRSIDDMVPPAVAAYIREKNLYREGDGTHGNDSDRGE